MDCMTSALVFNLATANLNLDVQLGDGIRLALENYMSSRHHSEFWVKGGYIQVDKLPMFSNPAVVDELCHRQDRHFEVNYGDQHFRRTDNGNAMWNGSWATTSWMPLPRRSVVKSMSNCQVASWPWLVSLVVLIGGDVQSVEIQT